MKRCKYTALAVEDLDNLYDYIAERDPDTALDLVTRLQLACDNLAQMPEMGRKREELSPSLRSLAVGKHIIFYRILEEDIEVIRILHGSRDVEKIINENG